MKFFSNRNKFKNLFIGRIRIHMKRMSLFFKGIFHSRSDLLVEECFNQSVSGVNFLLARGGVDVNSTSKEDITPLIAACYKGNTTIAKHLIEAGANVNYTNEEGITPLVAACYSGNVTLAKYLIKIGANVDEEGCMYEGCMHDKKTSRIVCEGTPLIVATKMKDNDMANMLIESGATVNKVYGMGKTALIYAAENGSLELVKTLVDKGADINTEFLDRYTKSVGRYTALAVAVKNGNKDVAEFLIDKGADVNHELCKEITIFNIAIDNKDKDLAELLIDKFADLDVLDREKEGTNGQFVKSLLESRSDLLVEECFNQSVSGVNFLLAKRGVDVNSTSKEGITPLIAACYKGNTTIAKHLIEAGADVNYTNEEGITPLVAACYSGNVTLAKYLIKIGANVDEEGCMYEGCMHDKKTSRIVCEGTPLIVATKMRDNDMANMLIESGATVNKVYGMGKTALIYAAENGNLELVKTLVDKGADVNTEFLDRYTKSVGRYTALAVAVKNGNKDMAEFLIDKGADVNHELCKERTIFSIAIDNKDKYLAELLIDKFVDLDVLDREKEGTNGQFVESLLKSGHIRFAIRSGDYELVTRQLGQAIKGKSIGYVNRLSEEIEAVADPEILNMLQTLCKCMKIGVDNSHHKTDISDACERKGDFRQNKITVKVAHL